MEETGNRPIKELLRVLPTRLRTAVLDAGTDGLEEIRVRAGRPVQLLYAQRERMLSLIADECFCTLLLESLCEHSAYAREAELREGFLTLRGGCRIGVSGRVALSDGKISHMAQIASFSLRIAREHKGCAEAALPLLLDRAGLPVPTLLISPPGVGKTTLLRDTARLLSDGDAGRRGFKVAIADERGELAGANGGVPLMDVGLRTDVMDGCPKAEAMERMLRSMSPEIIVTDEIGSTADAEAICRASAGGICVIASAHAGSVADAARKPYLAPLLQNGCFRQALLLARRGRELSLRAYPCGGALPCGGITI